MMGFEVLKFLKINSKGNWMNLSKEELIFMGFVFVFCLVFGCHVWLKMSSMYPRGGE